MQPLRSRACANPQNRISASLTPPKENQCRQTRSSLTLCESFRFKFTGKCCGQSEGVQGGRADGLCCRADTPLASSSSVSRIRPTTDQHRCFVAAWLMLILRKRSAHVGPDALPPTHPSVRLGPRLLRRNSPVLLLRAGPDVETRPKSPS